MTNVKTVVNIIALNSGDKNKLEHTKTFTIHHLFQKVFTRLIPAVVLSRAVVL